MKTKNLFITVLISILLTSCMPSSYFQVYKTNPSDKMTLKENLLVYEDENCKVSYNLWDEGGNIGFGFFNKTDKNIYLNLEESFFILNGVSNNYYKNRVFQSSSSTGTSASRIATATQSVTGINYFTLLQTNKTSATNSVGNITSSGYSVYYNEEKIICIPALTSKIITEYNINQSLVRDCDLYKYPNKNQINTMSFTKSDSPLVFSNRIAYTVGQTGNLIKFENGFYVTEISNYPESELVESKYDEYCGQKSMTMVKYFKEVSPDKFYIKYSKGQDSWIH